MKFYVGLDRPSQAVHFERAFISINAVRGRKKIVDSPAWILDCAGFTEIAAHGDYRHGPEEYAAEVSRLAGINPGLVAAVSQDYMCEPHMVERTGLTVAEHQRRTIERYDRLRELVRPDIYLMPVLQGYSVDDYVRHLAQYGSRLGPGAYVGVGSVCKRNTRVSVIEQILSAIKRERPDLRLHGFGVKTTALRSGLVLKLLESADSMAWSFSARKQGRNAHDWREAQAFIDRIATQPVQHAFDL